MVAEGVHSMQEDEDEVVAGAEVAVAPQRDQQWRSLWQL
jgi:hypothetical protein